MGQSIYKIHSVKNKLERNNRTLESKYIRNH